MIVFSTKGWNRTAKIMCAASVVAMLVGCGFAIHRLNYLSNATVAMATVSKVMEKQQEGGNLLYSTVYVFSDKKGNEVKVVSTKADRPAIGKVGDQIELLYTDNDPKNAIQNNFFAKWGLAIISGGVGLIYYFIFAIIAHLTDKRLQRDDNLVDAKPALV